MSIRNALVTQEHKIAEVLLEIEEQRESPAAMKDRESGLVYSARAQFLNFDST